MLTEESKFGVLYQRLKLTRLFNSWPHARSVSTDRPFDTFNRSSAGNTLEQAILEVDHSEIQPPFSTDSLEPGDCSNALMSFRAKLEALHNTMLNEFQTPKDSPQTKLKFQSDTQNDNQARGLISLKLPPPSKLSSSLATFFREHNLYLPCIDRQDFENRMLDWLTVGSYGAGDYTVTVPPHRTSFAALTCLILSVSEYISPENDPQALSDLGGEWYRRGVDTIGRARWSGELDLYQICFYTLEAIYLHYIERLAESSRAVSLAVSLSFRGGLNDQTTYAYLSPSARHARKALWWTLYYVDRWIAEKSGQPYHIRDMEIDVDDFSDSLVDKMNVETYTNVQNLSQLQSMVDWARLWTRVWDSFFALKAKHLGDAEEIEAMDTLIQATASALPVQLRWSAKTLSFRAQSGETRYEAGLRLLIYTVRSGQWNRSDCADEDRIETQLTPHGTAPQSSYG